MSTNRREVQDDPEFARLAAGDVSGAREAYRAQRVKAEEAQAMYSFLRSHPEIMPVQANEFILLNEVKTYNAVVTVPLLELALLKVGGSLIPTPLPERKPTPEQSRLEHNKRLSGMSVDQLRQEMQRNNPKQKIATDSVSPELLQMRTKADVLRLSPEALKRLMYRSDGSLRKMNSNRITELLQISN